MFDFLKKFFGTKSEKDIKSIQPLVDQILEIYPTLKNLSNDELRQKVSSLKQQIKNARLLPMPNAPAKLPKNMFCSRYIQN